MGDASGRYPSQQRYGCICDGGMGAPPPHYFGHRRRLAGVLGELNLIGISATPPLAWSLAGPVTPVGTTLALP